jgi:hypothetical protein
VCTVCEIAPEAVLQLECPDGGMEGGPHIFSMTEDLHMITMTGKILLCVESYLRPFCSWSARMVAWRGNSMGGGGGPGGGEGDRSFLARGEAVVLTSWDGRGRHADKRVFMVR